ncbi:MAG: 23S rRNA (adenine(2503)-C(2))-methyltransferase RlmN [Puniceicoccales bacterium]|nr:23S rRNA (adenine(2503)-C(2))-methyltransferase RlmN [Puniceicoccales bacterium]
MSFVLEKPPVFAETPDSLAARLVAIGEKAFRAGQVFDWLYKKRVFAPADMKNLPVSLRTWLAGTFDFEPNQPVRESISGDETRKHLQRLRDGSLVETVLLSAPREAESEDGGADAEGRVPSGAGAVTGHSRRRLTVCLSTQVGCAMGCRFCASGLEGFSRNLSAGEIVGQLLSALSVAAREAAPKTARDVVSGAGSPPPAVPVLPDNIVVMGMGEPFANYDNLLAALRVFNAPWALGLGARRVTVSTCGLVPRILDFARESLGTRLAVSLHGATNAVREQIMPINKTWPLEKLLPACEVFSREHGRMLTLEYILIDGLNDSSGQALALAGIAARLHAHVNLIPCNPVPGLPWRRPPSARSARFFDILCHRNISATLRREKGAGIDAACGQLRRQHAA